MVSAEASFETGFCRERPCSEAAMMRPTSAWTIAKFIRPWALLALLVAGCAAPLPPPPKPAGPPTTQVVLLPDPNGKVGIVEVSNPAGVQVLDQAWQATESKNFDALPSDPKTLDERQVRQSFREALEAEPIQPVTFIIHFKSSSASLLPESRALLAQVMEAVRVRESTDIIVSGHTDTVASVEYNRNLSLRRAQTVADMLVTRGIQRQHIQITYHGKSNPLVPTPDGVPEPRNRRVEITVR
jgi:outer membrane protein OmpA-like peptidoglycan-associated protein